MAFQEQRTTCSNSHIQRHLPLPVTRKHTTKQSIICIISSEWIYIYSSSVSEDFTLVNEFTNQTETHTCKGPGLHYLSSIIVFNKLFLIKSYEINLLSAICSLSRIIYSNHVLIEHFTFQWNVKNIKWSLMGC